MVAPLIAIALLPQGALEGGRSLWGDAPMRARANADGTASAGVGSGSVRVVRRGTNPWDAELKSPVFEPALQKGDVVYVTYQARALEAHHESGTAIWQVFFQRGAPPFDGFGNASGSAGKSWRTFHHAFRVDKDYPANATEMTLHCAGFEQAIEVRGLKGLLLPPATDMRSLPITLLTYRGREPNAPWRKKAAAMIEKNRKANLEIVVTKDGKPVAGVAVRVRMLRHAYPFGTFAENAAARDDPDSLKYRSYLASNWFSRITVPVYWTDWGWEYEPNRKEYLATIEWARRNGVRMKAHNLLWPSDQWLPTRIRPMRGEELKKALSDSIDERLKAIAGPLIENLDVVNELHSEHDIPDRVGSGPVVEYFVKARKVFPQADLVYNDYSVFEGELGGGEPFRMASEWTQRLIKEGAPATLSGWQAHFGEDLTPPEKVWQLIERWKKETGLPVEITEFDVNTRDEQTQADYLRDLLTAWFAHPNTRGFTMWGFFEKTQWLPNGAMFRSDWSRKPSANVWEKLVTKDWRTDVTLKTDAKGVVRSRGFHGDYSIEVGPKRVKVSLGSNGVRARLTL